MSSLRDMPCSKQGLEWHGPARCLAAVRFQEGWATCDGTREATLALVFPCVQRAQCVLATACLGLWLGMEHGFTLPACRRAACTACPCSRTSTASGGPRCRGWPYKKP